MLRPAIYRAVLLVFLLGVTGVVGYMGIAGMGFSDALYMTVITLSTVGYHEVQPLDGAARYFTMGLIVLGMGIVFYSVGIVARELIEGEFRETFGRRKVLRQVAHMKDHIIVCGFGRMGRIVCKELAAKPMPFVVIERGAEEVLALGEERYPFVQGDATEDSVLSEAHIDAAKGLVAALPTDSDNVYVVLTARELNPNLVIVARAEDSRSERKLLHAGATRVVSPYVIGGHRMAQSLLRPTVLDVIDLATHYQNIELQIEEVMVAEGGFGEGQTLQESGIRDKLGIIVIAIKRPNEEMLFNPAGSTRIMAGDRLVVMGQTSNLRALASKVTAA